MTGSRFDVIVVGAGIVGSTFACAIAPAGLRVALVEPQPFSTDWPTDGFDLRVSAVTRASERVFRALHAWDAMVARRVTPYREMQVWDAAGSGHIHFDSADLGEANLGHIIENRVILAALRERIAQLDTVSLLCPTRLHALAREDDSPNVILDDGSRLSAELVVGADGSGSALRTAARIGATGWSYHQSAIVAVVETSSGHHQTAWQRFSPDGPLAFLPLPGRHSSIVWSTSPENAQRLLELRDAAFLDALQRNFGDALGRMLAVGPRAAFPLKLEHAQRYVGERVALIGNAAHTIHPLAGQGLNLGILDGAALAQVVLEARSAGRDIGAPLVLRRYERWRKGENLAMIAAMDLFKRLFGSTFAPVPWLRSAGLNLTDAAVPVKRFFMRRALGLSGDLPRLARPAV